MIPVHGPVNHGIFAWMSVRMIPVPEDAHQPIIVPTIHAQAGIHINNFANTLNDYVNSRFAAFPVSGDTTGTPIHPQNLDGGSGGIHRIDIHQAPMLG